MCCFAVLSVCCWLLALCAALSRRQTCAVCVMLAVFVIAFFFPIVVASTNWLFVPNRLRAGQSCREQTVAGEWLRLAQAWQSLGFDLALSATGEQLTLTSLKLHRASRSFVSCCRCRVCRGFSTVGKAGSAQVIGGKRSRRRAVAETESNRPLNLDFDCACRVGFAFSRRSNQDCHFISEGEGVVCAASESVRTWDSTSTSFLHAPRSDFRRASAERCRCCAEACVSEVERLFERVELPSHHDASPYECWLLRCVTV